MYKKTTSVRVHARSVDQPLALLANYYFFLKENIFIIQSTTYIFIFYSVRVMQVISK